MSIVVALFSVLAVAIYRYGEESISTKSHPMTDILMGMGYPVIAIEQGGILIAEEMTDKEAEAFLEEANDHPELYIDGKKMEKGDGLIYIDFGNTSFDSGGEPD